MHFDLEKYEKARAILNVASDCSQLSFEVEEIIRVLNGMLIEALSALAEQRKIRKKESGLLSLVLGN